MQLLYLPIRDLTHTWMKVCAEVGRSLAHARCVGRAFLKHYYTRMRQSLHTNREVVIKSSEKIFSPSQIRLFHYMYGRVTHDRAVWADVLLSHGAQSDTTQRKLCHLPDLFS